MKFSATDPAPGGGTRRTSRSTPRAPPGYPSTADLTNGDRVTVELPGRGSLPARRVGDPAGRQPARRAARTASRSARSSTRAARPSPRRSPTNGAWTFYCSLHASYAGGEWDGMAGTINVAAAPTPGRADRRGLHRVPRQDRRRPRATGCARPTRAAPRRSRRRSTVSAEGQHTVEYRSVDKAGNAETAKTVEFGIDIPDPGFPVIQAFADPTAGTAPLLVRFSATGFDPDGGQLTYKWEFANGGFFGRAVERTFTQPGTYTGKVTATDDEGDKTSQEVTVTVRAPGIEPPTVEASSSVTHGRRRRERRRSPPRATTRTARTDDLPTAWDFGDGGSSFAQNPSHTYDAAGQLHREGDGQRRQRRDGDARRSRSRSPTRPATRPRSSRPTPTRAPAHRPAGGRRSRPRPATPTATR